jgi:hypothetical protein
MGDLVAEKRRNWGLFFFEILGGSFQATRDRPKSYS